MSANSCNTKFNMCTVGRTWHTANLSFGFFHCILNKRAGSASTECMHEDGQAHSHVPSNCQRFSENFQFDVLRKVSCELVSAIIAPFCMNKYSPKLVVVPVRDAGRCDPGSPITSGFQNKVRHSPMLTNYLPFDYQKCGRFLLRSPSPTLISATWCAEAMNLCRH